MTTPILKHTSRTETTAEELRFANRFIFKRVNITRETWNEMLFEHGQHFALLFSLMFDSKADWLCAHLVSAAPNSGDNHNWFWMWWKLKWMQDDYEFINNKAYQQPISYAHYKSYMLHSELLEQDLLNLIQTKIKLP